MTRARRDRWIAIGGVVAAAAVVVAVAMVRARGAEIPTSDRALTELYTLRAARLGLSVGAYSRFGWNHPGPLFFYLAAPLYVASGYRYAAIAMTALLVNVASLIGIGVLMRRHASAATTMAVGASLGLYLWRFDDLATSAWNPHVAVLPLALLFVASAAAAAGRLSALPLACAAFSFVVQAHVAFVVPAAACVAASAVVWLASQRSDARREGTSTRAIGVSIAVLAILWAPPLRDQLSGDRNLGQLVSFFASDAPRHELNRSVAVFAREFTTLVEPSDPALDAALYTRDAGSKALRGWQAAAGIEIVLLLILAGLALRSGRTFDAAWAGATAAAAIAAVLAIMRIRGAIEPYLIVWVGLLGTMAIGVLTGAALERVVAANSSAGSRLRAAADAVVALLCGGVLVTGLARVVREPVERPDAAAVRTLSGAAAAFLDDAHPGVPAIHIVQSAWPIAAGIVLQLTKADRPVAVERGWESMFGRPFRETGGEIALIVADVDFARAAEREDRRGLLLLAEKNGLYLYAPSR